MAAPEYENNSINSDKDGRAERESSMENNISYYRETAPGGTRRTTQDNVYEMTNPHTSNGDLSDNPAYVQTRYNRLFSWTRRRGINRFMAKKESANMSRCLCLMLALVSILACVLAIVSIIVLELQVRGLKNEIATLQRDLNRTSQSQLVSGPGGGSLREELNQLRVESERNITMLRELVMNQSTGMINSGNSNLMTLNLYEGCTTETVQCTERWDSGLRYYMDCATGPLPLDIPGMYTTNVLCDMSCNRDGDSLLKSTYIRPVDSGNIICGCEVTHPLRSTVGHGTLNAGTEIACNLIIRRCPMMITVRP